MIDVTVEECYKMLGGDYDKIINMLSAEALVKRFALKYLNDQSYNELKDSLGRGDTESAFRAAHNLKGVTGNLAFSRLYGCACKITEMLRGGDLDEAIAYFPTLTEDHNLTCEALSMLGA